MDGVRDLVVILGVPVENLTMEETLDRLDHFVYSGRRTGKSHQVVTINADFLVNAARDPELRYLLQSADLATADGMPLVWGGRLLNVPLKARVAGADLVPRLAERAAQKGYSIFFLGAAPGIAARAATILQQRSPNLRVAGVLSPDYRPVLEMDSSILDQIRAADPDILLVAFGNPKQEKWIELVKHQLQVPVMIGVGGSLDFITGNTKRAPVWMQKSGLEWFYRMVKEPGRLVRRYMADFIVFGLYFLRQFVFMYKGERGNTPSPVLLLAVGGIPVLKVDGPLTIKTYQSFIELSHQALDMCPFIVVDMAQVKFMDSAALGSLANFAKQAHEAGGELFLAGVTPKVKRFLRMLNLVDYFSICENQNRGWALASEVVQRENKNGKTQTIPDLIPDTGRITDTGRIPDTGINWHFIKAAKYLNSLEAAKLIQQGLEEIAAHAFVIIDLSRTVFLTSAGLAALAHLHRLAEERNGELRITGYSRDVLRVIKAGQLDHVLALYPDIVSATSQPPRVKNHPLQPLLVGGDVL